LDIPRLTHENERKERFRTTVRVYNVWRGGRKDGILGLWKSQLKSHIGPPLPPRRRKGARSRSLEEKKTSESIIPSAPEKEGKGEYRSFSKRTLPWLGKTIVETNFPPVDHKHLKKGEARSEKKPLKEKFPVSKTQRRRNDRMGKSTKANEHRETPNEQKGGISRRPGGGIRTPYAEENQKTAIITKKLQKKFGRKKKKT